MTSVSWGGGGGHREDGFCLSARSEGETYMYEAKGGYDILEVS
jgi:hypothetical protein